MSRSAAAEIAEADPTPSPSPTSEVQRSPRERVSRALREELENRDPAREAAFREAEQLYGHDPRAALHAFAAGTHPLQRLDGPETLEETKQQAAEALARGPVADE